MAENFDRIDFNGSGFIEMDELFALQRSIGRRGQGMQFSPNAAAQIPSGLNQSNPMQADKDGDRKLNRKEVTGDLSEKFDSIDTDEDGLIDANELFRIS